jgi:integrase
VAWRSEPIAHATRSEHAGRGRRSRRAHVVSTLLALRAFTAAEEAIDRDGGAVLQNPGELGALADAAGEWDGLVLLLAYCGLRWGEAIGLRVHDLDMLRKRASITENAVQSGNGIHVGTPKAHKQRTVPLPEFLLPYLARQCEGKRRDGLLWPGDDGGHSRRPHPVSGWFAKAVTASGVPRVRPHDLRHTAASLAVPAGANVKAVQKMLGNASAAMTLDVYADLFDDDLEAMATALDRARAQESVGKMWARRGQTDQ